MGRIPAIMAGFVALMLFRCGGGDGGQDTATDEAQDTGDTGDLPVEAPVDTTGDDSAGETGCASDGDCDDSDPCTEDACDEDFGTCSHDPVDADGDGYPAAEVEGTACVGGTDCDDEQAGVYPGAAPDCTGVVDMNCTAIDDRDEDEDGHTTTACSGGDDCDDADEDTYPGAVEICDAVDNDCDGDWTDAAGVDDDGDGVLDWDCGGGDCDDDDPYTLPGATDDACDLVDRDCDGETSEHIDDDGDGWIDDACDGLMTDHGTYLGIGDCNDTAVEAHPGVTEPDICDGLDLNCNGIDDDAGSCGPGMACGAAAECESVWVTVSAGTFTMGSPTSEPGRNADETEHQVSLTGAFEIQAIEVTQDEFFELMGYRPSYFGSCGGSCPVEQVNWHEAAAYANAASSRAGLAQCYTCSGSGTSVSCSPSSTYTSPYDCPGYRLPTEAEWEYAARAGTTTSTYNGTIDSSHLNCEMPNTVLDPIAWFCGNAGSTTHSAGGKTPNAWGLYDMLGNVWEWCHEWYGTYPGTTSDPWGPASGSYRVLRGGSWSHYTWGDRAARRNVVDPGGRIHSFGLRLARSL